MLEPGLPAFPSFSPPFSGLRSTDRTANRALKLVAEGLGDQVAEGTPLLRGQRLGLPKQRVGQIKRRLHNGSIYSFTGLVKKHGTVQVVIDVSGYFQ